MHSSVTSFRSLSSISRMNVPSTAYLSASEHPPFGMSGSWWQAPSPAATARTEVFKCVLANASSAASEATNRRPGRQDRVMSSIRISWWVSLAAIDDAVHVAPGPLTVAPGQTAERQAVTGARLPSTGPVMMRARCFRSSHVLARSDPPRPGSPTSDRASSGRRGEAVGPASRPANTRHLNHYRYLAFSPDRCSICDCPKRSAHRIIFRVINPPGAAGNPTP
jgi:hypothetical protein